ncbi:uncharacterized protein LOC135806525 [Sycon ciliatum]|uniref:uncharacterized protein LOC135806525 n=1 Tax=Sycon ciliatum TaxID=27933 RepID=UPI0020AD8EE0|eukprot:scpid7591/ scgid16950/ 
MFGAFRQFVRDLPIVGNSWTRQPVRTKIAKRTMPAYKLGMKYYKNHVVRQRHLVALQHGARYKPGENIIFGSGGMLHSALEGTVHTNHIYVARRRTRTDNGHPFKHKRIYISVVPLRKFEARYSLQRVYLPGERRAVVPDKYEDFLP